ncbi:hypothetical protein BKA70DRAFT_1220470 [Coprinopsis sp. MPI-PUGE-AT-0042]|nr:hypothetical protein BKA70DRAFT_1220470 [Coprinopsis sp. MPI-PUGE-AT-0042]
MSYGRGARRVRSLSHITEYHIPDSDFDDSDEQTGGREPRDEQNHSRRRAERRVRFSERDAFRNEQGPNENIAASKASTVTAETNVSNNSEVYHRTEHRNNATLEQDGIRARNDYYGSPLGIVYDGRQDWTTLHIFCGAVCLAS